MRTKLFTFLIIILCACGRKSTNETGNTAFVLQIDIFTEPETGITKLTELANDINYIPLQTTTSSLIGSNLRKIVNVGESIYILTGDEIFCFNIDGRYIFKLQRSGRGPEEYVNIYDFDVSSDNKKLIILSRKKILIYEISHSGFTFRRSVTLKDPSPFRISVVPETNNIFLAIPPWSGTEPTLSLLINNSGDSICIKPNCYKYEMIRKRNFIALNEMLVYTAGDLVCFKEKFSDTVFYVDAKENSFKPRIIFNSHGTLVTPGMRYGSEEVKNNTTFVPYVLETQRYIFYWYFKGEPLYGVLFDRATKSKYKLDIQNDMQVRLIEDITGGPSFKIEYMNKDYCSGGKLFSFVEAITLKKYVAGEDFKNARVKFPVGKEKLKELADSLKETDNPVLVIVTPKQ